MPEKWVLQQLQGLPLDIKVKKSQQRIREWYEHFDGNVYVSFSGGKDSTVLAHLVHEIYPCVPLVFSNTGLEYPEIQAFSREMGAEFIRPQMRFDEVISKYGYPIIGKEVAEAIHYARIIKNGQQAKETKRRRSDIKYDVKCLNYIRSRAELDDKRYVGKDENNKGTFIISDISSVNEDMSKSPFNKRKWKPLCEQTSFMISHKCCDTMKKKPIGKYNRSEKKYPYIGTLATESRLRFCAWLRHGCNAYEGRISSQPMSFWTEQDVLQYIQKNNIEIASVYGEIVGVDDDGMEYEPLPGVECKLKCTGCQRTGCIFCGFGCHLEKGETRFQRLAKTHPRQYEYCLGGGQWVDNPKYDPVAPKMDGDWVNWNPKKIWVPSKEGLGMKKVFDDCNQIYGKDFIRYE